MSTSKLDSRLEAFARKAAIQIMDRTLGQFETVTLGRVELENIVAGLYAAALEVGIEHGIKTAMATLKQSKEQS